MKRYGNLYERLIDKDNVMEAVRRSSKGKRDRRSVQRCLQDVEGTADKVIAVIEGGFEPSAPAVIVLYDARRQKERTICCPRYFPDQIVHHALMQVLIPCIMRGMADGCMASVPGRGNHAAVRKVERWVREDRKHTKYCLQMDVRHFYASVQTEKIKERLRRLVKDERFLDVLFRVIDSSPVPGLPIGFYTSQWLANLYLQDFDHAASERWGASHYVRYADDVLAFSPSKRKLHRMRREMADMLAELGLEMKPDWQVFRVLPKRPISFLGYDIAPKLTKLRSRTWLHMTRRIRAVARKRRPTARDARQVMSMLGSMRHVPHDQFMRKHVYPYISIKRLKELIRNDSRRVQRQAACR